MDDMNFKPNSHKYREAQQGDTERKRPEKVVKGTVKVKKKSEIRKFTDVFIAEDIGSVKQYLMNEVLVPAAKRTVSELVKNGIDSLIYGITGRRVNGSGGSSSTPVHISYRDCYDTGTRNYRDAPVIRSRFNYDDFTFESRGEAEYVLDQMDAILDKYRMVTVLDLYDLVGKTCDHTGNKYGWTALGTAKVVPVNGGYALKLPRATPID